MSIKKSTKIFNFFLLISSFILLFSCVSYFWLYYGKVTKLKYEIFSRVPVPIGRVGKQNIYADEIIFYKKLFLLTFGKEQAFQSILQTLIVNKKIEEVAENLNLQATDAQIENYFEILTKRTDFNDQLRKLGINIHQFKKKFIKYFIVKNNLKIWHNSQENLNKQGYELAKKIQSQAFDQEAFSRLAAKYSQDESSNFFDGDMGLNETGDLLPEISEALTKLKLGQTSVTPSSEGIHILRLEGEDNKGFQGTKRYNFKQIFLPLLGFEDWLKAASEPVVSKIYINF